MSTADQDTAPRFDEPRLADDEWLEVTHQDGGRAAVADHDWTAIYDVVMQGLDNYEPPGTADGHLSPAQREQIADTVTDHRAASLAGGALRSRTSWWSRGRAGEPPS